MTPYKDILDLPEQPTPEGPWRRIMRWITQRRLIQFAIFWACAIIATGTIEDSSLLFGLTFIEFIAVPLASLLFSAILCGVFYSFLKDYKKMVLLVAIWLHIAFNMVLLFGVFVDNWLR